MQDTRVTPVALQGGLNLAASPLNAQSGEARVLHNYRVDGLGRYERIKGHVRFDGQTSPVGQPFTAVRVNKGVDRDIGSQVVGSNGAVGVLAGQDQKESYYILIAVQGEFERNTTLDRGEEILDAFRNNSGQGIQKTQEYRKGVENIYRERIKAVPGSGPIRGVAIFGGRTFAWRDNAAGDETMMWESSADSWMPVAVQPPRIYVPPYAYDLLIYAQEAGTKDHYKCGYFRTGPWYGDVLLPTGPDAEKVIELAYSHPTDTSTQIIFDTGVNLGDMWELDVYVNDFLMYKFDGDFVAVTQPEDASDSRYVINIDGKHELWLPNQSVGARFVSMADKPGPETDQWAIVAPASAKEGTAALFRVGCVRQDGQPGGGRVFTWKLEGIQQADLASGALTGTGTTDAAGNTDITVNTTADGYTENEAIRLRVTTPAKHTIEASVDLADKQLPEGTHTYVLSGPANLKEGHRGTYQVKVVNAVGEVVSGQAVQWAFNAPAAQANFPVSGTSRTNAAGMIAIPMEIKPGSGLTSMTFSMAAPVARSMSVTLQPYVAPARFQLHRTPDAAGRYYGFIITPRNYITMSSPVTLEGVVFRNTSRAVFPGTPVKIEIQHVKSPAVGADRRTSRIASTRTIDLTADDKGGFSTIIQTTAAEGTRWKFAAAGYLDYGDSELNVLLNGIKIATLKVNYDTDINPQGTFLGVDWASVGSL